MESLAETRQRLDAKRHEMFSAYEEAGPEMDLSRITAIDGDYDRKRAVLRQWDEEIKELERNEDQLTHMQRIRDENERALRKASEPERLLPFPNGNGHAPGTIGTLRV